MIGIYMRWFAALVGAGALLVAVVYLRRPAERTLAMMRPLSLAAIFAAICSFTSGMAEVLKGMGGTLWATRANPTPSINLGAVCMGLSETLIALFVANAFLAIAWLLVTAGIRRQA